MDTTLSPHVGDLVALGRRARWALGFRLLLSLSPVLAWCLLPDMRTGALHQVLQATSGYVIAIVTADLVRRLGRGPALWSIGTSLLLDGVYLAWTLRFTGGLEGPMSLLLIVHAMAITLLASFRSGLKIAIWDSLLLVCVLQADFDGTLGATLLGPKFPTTRLATLLAIIWMTAFTTAAFAAVNERELRRRRYDMEVLRQLALDLEDCYELQAIATRLTILCRDELLARRVLVLLDPSPSELPGGTGATQGAQGDYAALVCASGESLQYGAPPTRLQADSIVVQAMTTHRAILRAAPSPVGDDWVEAIMPQARNIVVVPFHAQGRVQGAAILEYGVDRGGWLRSTVAIDRRVLATAEQATAHAALAAGRAYLMHCLRRAAETDGLTGIANRRTFDAVLARAVAPVHAGRDSHCSVVLIDLDHFKSINDRHGHLVGDEVLKAMATALRTSARPGDIPARYGGEEFAVIMPGTGLQGALAAAERLRAVIEALQGPVPVTASMGVASSREHGAEPTVLLAAADSALYAAKTAGRNRVVAAPTRLPEPRVHEA